MSILSMDSILHAIDLDIWLISVYQEEINKMGKEMFCASIVTDLVILQDSAKVGMMTEKVR